MGNKPTVTLTLAGDEKKLTQAFDEVGASSRQMADKVESASRDMGSSMDRASEGFDRVDTSAMGFRDSITGVQDTMTAFKAPNLDESTAKVEKAQAAYDGLTATLENQRDALEALKKSDPKNESLIAAKEAEIEATENAIDAQQDELSAMKDVESQSLSLGERLFYLGAGIGDMASAMVNLIIPALRGFWTVLVETVIPAVWSFTTALLANPITWVVLGIAALIAILYLLGVRWDDIKNIVGNVVGWIVDRWNGLMSFFAGIPDWFGRLGSAIGSAISAGFKGAINWIVDRLNWLIDVANKVIYGINVVNPFSDIPDIPHIPRMHTGGVVPGPPGSETMAILQAGETVTSAGSSTGGVVTVQFTGDVDSAFASAFQKLVETGAIPIQFQGA